MLSILSVLSLALLLLLLLALLLLAARRLLTLPEDLLKGPHFGEVHIRLRATNIPGGIDMPGAELAYRVHDVAADPETLVVVNCAGRTRSIIGCQSLRNAGIPNRVVALKDGTMGWELAGYECERGASRIAQPPTAGGLARARAAADSVASRFRVRFASRAQVETWRAALTPYGA